MEFGALHLAGYIKIQSVHSSPDLLCSLLNLEVNLKGIKGIKGILLLTALFSVPSVHPRV